MMIKRVCCTALYLLSVERPLETTVTVEEHYKAIFVKSFNLVLECNSERQVTLAYSKDRI